MTGFLHRDEGDDIGIEVLNNSREVHQRSCQPVDLVDHHHVDLSLISRSSR